MTNLLDYITWRGDLRLAVDPFNEIDGVILARISYLPFDLLDLAEDSRLTVRETMTAFLGIPELESKLLFRTDIALIRALERSERFRHMLLTDYRNTIDTKLETQFCAITVHLGDGTLCVSYRGTDDTLVGWKEDFNMGYLSPVPAQELAVAYFREMAEKYPRTFLLAGHSKGGNLAIFAGAFCGDVQDRVRDVYNFDGPGFDSKLMGQPGFAGIRSRIHTLVPQSSVVGMLLEHEEAYTVVHSGQTGIMQHDVYSWDVERNHFIYMERVSGSSRFLDSAVKEWLRGMDYAQREAFVEALYELLRDTNIRSLREMRKNSFASVHAIVKSLAGMDENTRKMLTATISALVRCAGEVLREEITDSL